MSTGSRATSPCPRHWPEASNGCGRMWSSTSPVRRRWPAPGSSPIVPSRSTPLEPSTCSRLCDRSRSIRLSSSRPRPRSTALLTGRDNRSTKAHRCARSLPMQPARRRRTSSPRSITAASISGPSGSVSSRTPVPAVHRSLQRPASPARSPGSSTASILRSWPSAISNRSAISPTSGTSRAPTGQQPSAVCRARHTTWAAAVGSAFAKCSISSWAEPRLPSRPGWIPIGCARRISNAWWLTPRRSTRPRAGNRRSRSNRRSRIFSIGGGRTIETKT